MREESYYCMTSNVSWQKHKNVLYVTDERNGCIYPFSGTSFDIMLLIIDSKFCVDKIIDEMSDKYKVARDIIMSDVKEFIKELEEIKILESAA